MLMRSTLLITILSALLLTVAFSMPSLTEYGGQNCPGTCVQSFSCDTRCAPVSTGQTGSVLRWCTSAVSTSNTQCCCGCTTVVDTYSNNQPSYFWFEYDNMTCNSFCPPNFYPPTSSGYSCKPCNSWCLTCTGGSNTQCSTCAAVAYQLNLTACYAYTTPQNPTLTTKLNPCPNGYYGLQITKVCVACPAGCTICAIELTWQMPNAATFATSYNQNNINCTGYGDPLCGYTLKCYQCTTGYLLVNGFCVANTKCYQYAKYNSASGGSFSLANCFCFSGFSLQFPGYCFKCHYTCKTCSGISSSSCITCPDGAVPALGSCYYNFTYNQLVNWQSGMPTIGTGNQWESNAATLTAGVQQEQCGQATYVFGYYGYYNQGVYGTTLGLSYGASMFPSGAYITYTDASLFAGVAHYGVHFRATLLFIDDWVNGMSILFTEGGYNRHQFYYQMQNIPGEYLCGYNTHDHLDNVDFWFTHTGNGINLKIYSSSNTHQWGIKQVVIHVLTCDSTCATCSGSTANDCLTCSDPLKIPVNGYCQCDSGNGYYLKGGSCVTDCSPDIKDDLTYQCVATCSFPNDFIYTDGLGAKSCVVNCPATYYKKIDLVTSIKTCVLDCYDVGQTDITQNQFKFDGLELVCFNQCPSGTFGDPVSHSCVRYCPTYNPSTDDGYFSHTYFCYESCPSGWAFVPQRACLSSCPSGYYKNYLLKSLTNSSICQQQCSITMSGQFLYGDNSTGYCTDHCSSGTYGDIDTNLCLAVCNSSSFGQSITSGGVTQRLCVINCSLAANLFGNPQTGFCVSAMNCPDNYYGDPLTYQCTMTCSGLAYFGNNSTKMCITAACSGGAFRQNDTKICVASCLNNNSLLAEEWGDSTSGYCVASCYGSYFGDPQQNNQCVQTCTASPSPTFGLDYMCVVNCSNTTWADPFHPNRICTTSCTSTPTDSYGYNLTRQCVTHCPDGQFAHNVSGIPLCVVGCMQNSGLFGNILNNRCQSQCPAPYYGDVTGNRTCLLKCPWPYYASNCTMSGSTIVLSLDRVCRVDCSSCGWADDSSQTCAWDPSGCENYTYAHETNHRCVIAMSCAGYADPLTRYCISPCFQNGSAIYFGDPSTKQCVLICPQSPDYFGDNTTQLCVSSCSNSQVRDPQYWRRCVSIGLCSRTPLALYGDSVQSLCVTALNCTLGYYGDNNTNSCIAICPGPTYLYADNVTRECVQQCSLSWFALNITVGQGVCSQFCPLGQWADNYTVECTTRCTSQTYGVNYTSSWSSWTHSFTSYGVCQNQCPSGQFARDEDNLCVSNCGNNNQSDLWGDPLSKTCKTTPFDCPSGYYADNTTHMCVVPLSCSNVGGIQYRADNKTKQCVPICPADVHNFADMVKYLCVAVCPSGYYGYNGTLQCQTQCKNPSTNLFDGSFADPQLRICVEICSDVPMSTFGQNVTFTCVEAKYCPSLTWAEVTVYNRQCRPICPPPNTNAKGNAQMYAENLTKTCVAQCPTYSYADLSTGEGLCVYVCPSLINGTKQYADNSTKKCVTICPVANGTFGDNDTLSCVNTCPVGSYAQVTPNRYCVAKCAIGTWGQDIKRTCVTSPLLCPTVNGTMYYAQNVSTMCVRTCPAPNGGDPGSWGQNTTRACVPSCMLNNGTQSGYKWNLTRVCIDICPAEIGVDGSYSDQGMCYYVCMTASYYRDPQTNRSCQSSCSYSPTEQWADDTTMRCLSSCPTFPQQYYADSLLHKCVSTCSSSQRKLESTKKCVSSCPNGTFFNSDTYQCLSICPVDTTTNVQLYGDNSSATGQHSCVKDVDCPYGYYADDNLGLCVSACSEQQWIYGKNCVPQCPDGYYGNPNTLECVVPTGCPNNYYADNQTVTCVSVCQGSFADSSTQTCVFVCPTITGTKYYADPVTRQCATTCTFNNTIKLIKNDVNQTCVSQCDPTLFFDPFTFNCTPTCSNNYYSDNSTRTCVSVCPSTPSLFGENATYTCVQTCLVATQFRFIAARVCVYPCPANYYMENITRNCVSYCPNMTYSDSITGYCVSNCSTTQYSYDPTNQCKSTCLSPYFNDPTTYKCVLDCPHSPTTYFQVVQGLSRYCDTSCPINQFRDYTQYVCTSNCPLSPVTYADTTSGSCLAVCSSGFYGYLTDRTCKSTCPNSMFADPLTRLCVSQCDPDLGLFGDSNKAIPACVQTCTSGSYADPYTQTCVSTCRTATPKMWAYDNGDISNPIRQCVYSCPYPWVADNTTNKCFLQCNNAARPYLDKASKQCVSTCSSPVYQFAYMPLGQPVNGQCVKFCPTVGAVPYFSLSTNNTCVRKCPTGLFGTTTNNTCTSTCSLANNLYADSENSLCVLQCTHNASFFSYANEFTRTCVTTCPSSKGLVGDRLIWKCVPRCSSLSQWADLVAGYCKSQCPLNYFADNNTQTCVSNCSLYTLMYGNTATRQCVYQCPGTLYADKANRLCVVATSCPSGTFAFNTSRECISKCPTSPNLFGDPFTQICQSSCPIVGSTKYYADPVTRICVNLCPDVPALFAQNVTQKCIASCPPFSYADNYTRFCIGVCSVVGMQTFADNTTNLCVKQCPIQPNMYASNYTWECVLNCPSTPSMYADNSTRTCVYYCPGGQNNTYADDSTRTCVQTCPNTTYNQNSTRQCKANCLTGYADPKSKYCIAQCPPRSYGDNSTWNCVSTCPLVLSVQTFAQDGNSICMKDCLPFFGTYADPYTKKCVKICPISQGYFAEPNSRTCVATCPTSPSLFADSSTRFCVPTCPSQPSLFAINTSRICTANCPSDSWADKNSRVCLGLCLTTPQTFGDNSTWTCVSICPTKPNYYADSSTHFCVPTCPSNPDLYADNITRKCVYNCPNLTYADPTTRRCVQTCPYGYFGVNSTWRCQLTCPWRQFADSLLNVCVKVCSMDPIFYGNPDTLICVGQCPASNYSFGNPLTQECVNYQSNGTSGCPIAYFADNHTRLCVEVCPMDQDTYGDNSTWKCVIQCPATDSTFADNSTMRCVKICPAYPDYYAQPYSRRCVHNCLPPTANYSGSFSSNHTRQCVETCPSTPDYYSDNSTGRCVYYCPRQPLTFADNDTRRCVAVCPSTPDIYGDLKTLRCVQQCPRDQQTYADNNTRLCVKICPNDTSPPLYAQNTTLRCLPACPNNSYADNHTQKCVAVCPRYPETYGDPSTNKCVVTCPSTPDIYADPVSQMCIGICELGYYAENTTRRCLVQCPYNETNWADNLTGRCVSKCPMSQLTWGDNQTQRCVSQCPLNPITYADNITQTCVHICNNQTNGGYADNSTRICVAMCPDRSYGDITTRYCVRYCPAGWYGYTGTNLCVLSCPGGWFADNTTWMCVLQCPRGQSLYGENINNTCVYSCPDTTYASDQIQQCVSRCPNSSQTSLGHDTFGLNSTNDCVEECPVPLYGYPVDQVCVNTCPDPYYPNITDHRCYACPASCANCSYPQLCITCNSGWFLYSGACLQSCPTFPVITYANPNRICGTAQQCTQGYYANNATKTCVSSCPAGTYVNLAAQSCDSCSRGCINCTSVSNCLKCNPSAAIWSNYTCHLYCSPLRRYYTTKGCVSACPTGNYLSLTTCLNCSSICKTCIITASNCLICANGYYRSNGICVSQCPNNTIAQAVNGSQTCVSCSIANCKQTPLSYQVTQFVDNYKYNIQIQFNQPVNITAEIDKIIQIQEVTKKRLLAVTTYVYLNYTIYDYGNGLYTFVLNNYTPSQGSELEVQILDPSAIQTASGQMPQSTRSSLAVNTANVYTLDSYSPAVDTVVMLMAIVAFILLLLTFGAQHSIWMPMYDFMQWAICLVLVNITYPPNLLYSLRSSLASALNFLPNFFASAFNKASYSSNYSNNNVYSLMEDAAFLRVMGHLYFLLLMIVLFIIIVLILTKKAPSKEIKKGAKQMLRESIWKRHLHGVIYLFFLPVFMFSIYNMRIYSYLATSPMQIYSIINTYIFMTLFLVFVFYCLYKLRRLVIDHPVGYLMLQKAYNFILLQKTVLIENHNHHFNHDKNQFNLTDAREPRVNQLMIFPYPIETKVSPWEVAFPLISYLHKLLTAIFLTMAWSNPVIQLILLILLNTAFLVYLAVRKPFFEVKNRQYNNRIYIHNLLIIIIMELVLLIFVFLYSDLQTDKRVLICNFVVALLIWGFLFNTVYFIFRTYHYYHQHLWKLFVRSDFFRVNYIVEHLEWVQDYEKEDKKLMKQVRSRPEFLQAIRVETGQALANMVMRDPSVSTNTKEKMKALNLRPNKAQIASKQFGQIFSTLANQRQHSHKSIASSERLSKNERKKVRDKIFGQKDPNEKEMDTYHKLEMIDEKEEKGDEQSHQEQISEETQYEYEYVEEQYPEGTPMDQIMNGCKKGDIAMPLD